MNAALRPPWVRNVAGDGRTDRRVSATPDGRLAIGDTGGTVRPTPQTENRGRVCWRLQSNRENEEDQVSWTSIGPGRRGIGASA